MASIDAIVEDDFLSHVKTVRKEIQNKFKRAHEALQEREAALLDKLQGLEDEYMGVSIPQQIQQLSISKDGLKESLKGNENKDILDQSLAVFDARIKELENKVQKAKLTYKNVVLAWDDELEKKLSVTGDIHLNTIKQIRRDYKKLGEPVATFGKHIDGTKSSPGVFGSPRGIAINPLNNFLYICDSCNNRVQVFNKSFEFVFQFKEQMDYPCGICIKQNQIYVTQFNSNRLTVYSTEGRYLQSVGREGKKELEFDKPRGIDCSTEMNKIYIAEWGNDRVHCLNSNLTFHSLIDNIFGARDVQLTSKEIIVLSDRNPCVFIFTYSHQLIRETIPRGEGHPLIHPIRFVIDEDFNFLISDFKSHSICVYSYEGEFICKFGKEGGVRGDFINPTGITICPQGRIVVTSLNPNHCVQIF